MADCYPYIPILSIRSWARATAANLKTATEETFTSNSDSIVVKRNQKATGSLGGTFDLNFPFNGYLVVAQGIPVFFVFMFFHLTQFLAS